MTLHPVLPAAILLAVTAVLILMRLVALRRALSHRNTGGSWPVLLRWGGLTLAVLLVLLASFRPTIDDTNASAESGPNGPNVNVFFVVDRSVNSRVEDFAAGKSRMAGIRQDMTALVARYPGARFAVISFSSSAEVGWPLSEDIWSLKPMIAGLSPYTSATPDAVYQVNATAAGDILRYKLQQAERQYPRSANLVYYFGSGAGGSRAPQGKFDLGSAKPTGGAVLGYGTAAGGPVPDRLVDGTVFYAIDAQSGARLNSAINERALTTIADQLGVSYFHRADGESIDAVAANVAGADEPISTSGSGGPVELYWMLSLLAAHLLLLETYLTIRQFRRQRGVRRDVTS